MKAILTGGFLILGACGGAPFTVEGSADPSPVAPPVAASAASSAPTPATSAAPTPSASAAPSAPAPAPSAATVPDAGAFGTARSQNDDAGTGDADVCAQSPNVHQNGFGGNWHDCVPAGTYSPVDVGLAEAVKACNSSPFSNGNTCRGVSGLCVPYATNVPQLSPTGNQNQYYWVVGSVPVGSAGDNVALTGQNVFVDVPGRSPVQCEFPAPVSTWN